MMTEKVKIQEKKSYALLINVVIFALYTISAFMDPSGGYGMIFVTLISIIHAIVLILILNMLPVGHAVVLLAAGLVFCMLPKSKELGKQMTLAALAIFLVGVGVCVWTLVGLMRP